MKRKKILSLILSFTLTALLTVNQGRIVKAEEIEKPELTVSSVEGENYASLNWDSSNKDKYSSYRIFSKESHESEFQSIPSKQNVKVLNIYPNQGDNLEGWMENPNSEDEKGYGKGLISVDKVSINDFNRDPSRYMKDSKGEWIYDVIMLGSWDTNANAVPSDDAVNMFREFIDSGRGFLAGHDTIGFNWGTSKGLSKIRDKFNIKVGYWDNRSNGYDNGYNYFGGYTGNKVTVKRKGLLTNFPWKIEDTKNAKELDKDNNVVLTVPESHSTSNFAYGDIWMTYSNNTKYSGSNFPSSLDVYSNFYLTTWNNTAMIQTGHSNGQATSDEQKVLANTLFYLAQVTEDTKWDDHKGQDLSAPSKPEVKGVARDSINNKITISYDESQDTGSSYYYYVEAREKSTGNTVDSDVETTVVKSGIKGYSIVVDQNKDTIPDNIVETTSTEFTMDNKFNDDYYVHVASVDNAGNVSEVSTYKYVYPTLNLIAGDLNKDNNTVTIKAEGKVTDETTIKSITLPNGEVIEGANSEFIVDVNGTYTFKAIDNEGKEVSADITISNIPGKVTLDDIKVDEYDNSVVLNFDISDKTQEYAVNINSKKSDEEEFKTVTANGTNYVDSEAKDVTAPEKSEIKSVVTNKEDGTTLINITEAIDKGTSYDYYVEATGLNSSLTSKSETKSATVTSGIKGYSIVVDQNEDTIPDGTITTTSTEYTFDKIFDTDFYVHVATVDNSGNISEVSTFKYAYPTMKLTANTTEIVKDTVTISAEALCEGNSIVKVITPDGKEVEGDKAEFTVDVNGTYTFKAVDNKGDEVTQSIEVNNIIPDVILNVEPNMNRVHLQEHFVTNITADHINDIGGFDLVVKYDSSKLKLTGIAKVKGVKYVIKKLGAGEIRLTVFGITDKNFVYSKKTLLTLGFDPIAAGKAKIDITKAKISNGLLLEKKLRDAECGETTINIVDRKLTSVNSEDNEFTLLDATIVSRHIGEKPEELLLTGIDADLDLDGDIDEADVDKAYELMMKNPNYEI